MSEREIGDLGILRNAHAIIFLLEWTHRPRRIYILIGVCCCSFILYTAFTNKESCCCNLLAFTFYHYLPEVFVSFVLFNQLTLKNLIITSFLCFSFSFWDWLKAVSLPLSLSVTVIAVLQYLNSQIKVPE